MSPMTMAEVLVAEFEMEMASTRKMLERVPDDKLGWQPHEKSMTLKRLASHLAEMPGWTKAILDQDELDLAGPYEPPQAASNAELLEFFDANVATFKSALAGRSDDHLLQSWTLRHGERTIMKAPRTAALRGFVLNHVYHHRGQLSVYLRLLDVPLPPVYGPTADDRAGFGG